MLLTSLRHENVAGFRHTDPRNFPSTSVATQSIFQPVAQGPISCVSLGSQVDSSLSKVTPYDNLDMTRILTEVKNYKCPVCSRELADRYMFRRHYMIHTGEKPYVCPICPYRSIQKGDLKFHMIRKHR